MSQHTHSNPEPGHEAWFEQEPQHSVPPPSSLRPPPATLPRLSRTLLAGALVGGVGASLALLLSGMVAVQSGVQPEVHRVIGSQWAFGAAAAAGLLIGGASALATRHVRRVLPVLLFSVLFVPASWFVFQVIVLRGLSPELAASLPLPSMLAGAVLFSTMLVLIMPLRGR